MDAFRKPIVQPLGKSLLCKRRFRGTNGSAKKCFPNLPYPLFFPITHKEKQMTRKFERLLCEENGKREGTVAVYPSVSKSREDKNKERAELAGAG